MKKELENWLKSSAGRFNEIYTTNRCAVRKRCLLTVLQVFFALIAIASVILLFASNYIDSNQLIGSNLGLVSIQKIGNPIVLNVIFVVSTVWSLLALWLMRLIKLSNKHIADFYYFWDRHIESGRKLIKETNT